MEPDENPIAVSLFSGLGGIDIGLHRAGIKTAVCVEQASEPAKSLKVNSKHHSEDTPDWVVSSGGYPWRVIDKDIHQVTVDDILNKGGLTQDEIDLVVGGPPCQTFSRSNEGSREGTGSERGRLFEEYARVVQALEPEAFLFENVRGLASSNGGEDLSIINMTLKGERRSSQYDGPLTDYGVNYEVLNSADFGIPQTRKRLFILGLRSGGSPTFPEHSHEEPPSSGGHQDWVSVGDSLSEFDLDSDIESKGGYKNAVGGEYGYLLQDIPEGANYQHFSDRRYDPQEERYVERSDGEMKDKVFDWRSRHWNYLLMLGPFTGDPDHYLNLSRCV
jgi:DNA (cytosine-5)-methyltransferase 1